MNRGFRIAIGSIYTESNHLGGKPTDLACFERGEIRRGNDILEVKTGYVGGMLRVLRARHAEVKPLLVASACPGGPLTEACYRDLKNDLLQRLAGSLPVHGILLPLHGAAAAEGVEDLEGDLLEAIRGLVGNAIPIVATLDLHAHVTARMMKHATALIALETYPHRDAESTGERGAEMLLDILERKCKPVMALAKVPVLVSAIKGSTEGEDPFAEIMRFAKAYESKAKVLSTSVFLVHPYLDAPDMGGGGLVVTDGDRDLAESLAREIARRYWHRRIDLDPPTLLPSAAIAQGKKIPGGPILLVETSDCCGGGAAGDSVITLKALRDANVDECCFVPVVDPEVAALCHRVGEGGYLTTSLGHKLDPRWGDPLSVTGVVTRLGGGRFIYRGGMWDGQSAEMGPSAVLRLGTIEVLVTTYGTYDWADEQFCSMGMNPRDAKFIVVKNPMNYRLGYRGVARAAYVLDTPGPTPATLRGVHFQRMQRPYYPADLNRVDLEPVILMR